MSATEKGRILAKDSFIRSELNFLNFQPKKRMAAYSPKRVQVFGLKSSVSEGKSARFTFSRGWAHLAKYSPLEQALRLRLRGALAQGNADPARLAALLGVSQRSMQRRLLEVGRSYSDILETFRREEAAQLLCNVKIPLVSVAERLGYREQTSFTRAFRRWTGTTPSAWRAQRLSSAR